MSNANVINPMIYGGKGMVVKIFSRFDSNVWSHTIDVKKFTNKFNELDVNSFICVNQNVHTNGSGDITNSKPFYVEKYDAQNGILTIRWEVDKGMYYSACNVSVYMLVGCEKIDNIPTQPIK